MPDILTFEQIAASTEALTIYRANYSPELADAFTVYRNTGIRSSELLDRSLWSFEGGDAALLTPLKGNYVRHIKAPFLPDSYKEWLLGISNRFDWMTVRQLEHHFNRFYSYPLVTKGLKQSALYMFRYYYVKKLFLDNPDISFVTSEMGWHEEAIAWSYVNAELII